MSVIFSLQAFKNLNLNIVILILYVEANTDGAVVLFCYAGSLTMDEFHRYGDIAYEFEWIEMPIELQKFILLIIADAQHPLIFEYYRFESYVFYKGLYL